MDKRIFVEKKADFRVKSQSLVKELQHNLQLKTLNDLRIVQVYDVFNLAEDLFARAEKHIFSEQVTDTVLDEAAVKADLEKYAFFAIESLPGQFDQRAASSQEALLLLGSSNDVTVNTAQLYLVNKDIDANELEAVKNYLLNPVDSRFKDITVGIAKQDFSESDKTIPSLDFFETYTAEDFSKYKAEQGLAMEVDDLLFIQDYFKSIGRVPTETELKVLDTYWSDHCRHTTFSTELKNVIIFNSVQVPHYNYVGDSILGYKSHMGAGSITSNVKSDKTLVVVKDVYDTKEEIETGRKKFGAMLGDHVEVGCNSVLNPGTVIGRNSNIYPLSRVRGVIPANHIFKDKDNVVLKK